MTIPDDETFDLRLRLLDHQVVDTEGRMLCKVDDVEFEQGPEGTFHVRALLCGPRALGPRFPGRLGLWLVRAARRLAAPGADDPQQIRFERVTGIGSAVVVDPADDLDLAPLEDWVREHVIDRIPGSRGAGE